MIFIEDRAANSIIFVKREDGGVYVETRTLSGSPQVFVFDGEAMDELKKWWESND